MSKQRKLEHGEAEIRIQDVPSTSERNVVLERVPLVSFDNGKQGIYLLDPKHNIRIWVRWRK